MKKLFSALLLALTLSASAMAYVPTVPLVLLTGKDMTEYTLKECTMNETTGRITAVISGGYPPSSAAKQKAIQTLTAKFRVPMARARKVDTNEFSFCFSVDGTQFQRVYDRYLDYDGAVIYEAKVDTRKWETAKPQLTSGKAYQLSREIFAQLEKGNANDVPGAPPADPAPQHEKQKPEPKKQAPKNNVQQPKPAPANAPGRAITPKEWQSLSFAQVQAALGKNTDLNEFIPYTAPDGSETEGYVLAAVAARKDADAARILNLLLDRGAAADSDQTTLANYVLTHASAPDMRLVERLAATKELLDPAFLASCSAGAVEVAERLLAAGASVNESPFDPDTTVLLEALNVKAAPRIIELLVQRGADTAREGEVYDAKTGETFRGTPAQLAKARGYGQNVISLLQ